LGQINKVIEAINTSTTQEIDYLRQLTATSNNVKILLLLFM